MAIKVVQGLVVALLLIIGGVVLVVQVTARDSKTEDQELSKPEGSLTQIPDTNGEPSALTPTPSPTPTPAPVANPMESLDSFQAGVNLVFYGKDDEFERWINPFLERMVDINVNHLSVVVPIYQDGYRSIEVYNHPTNTPNLSDILNLIAKAHSRGFTITLRPLMDELSFVPEGQWRGKPGANRCWCMV